MRTDKTQANPLPSWYGGPSKTSILRFVEAVTAEGGPEFVPPLDRIAVFDNDGTLWSEKPLYFQVAFALDRTEVNEYIFTVLTGNKTKTFGCIEPFDSATLLVARYFDIRAAGS